ncbi:preprotein translocase subunit SecA [Helicobacter pylori]|jgi:protein translocase subunit secA|uniref:Protein translocase subunit SecA n=3 Tax=Helicobacter pylori TaxID=210 RepID=SECA_HELPY|nr:preprotein translocase subunit SecA [Helicobacter pylori]O25475.1 RecName: Full=Protein translocase subunit SecA [Helicobacter pylori 26695]AAD07830.1 preprotein translocase subunit (secA) [Helicobacter pylori 26695]AFV41997.1 preprotein translocase subunit SecA [Helicobacter pylori 26695]AFV43590.1 preprotein translocase subunit SecA [Helicobacter pylori Rif1]AFV45184.1 preprotein translocase subunit SecA [Helicobacter pylori Rif2]AJF09048.1 preprotein translocase subunit SecA [Helicobact
MIKAIIGKIIGTRNDRWIKQYKKQVLTINALEPTYEKMSDDELQNAFEELKKRVRSTEKDLQEKTLLEVLPESFAITREASKRILKMCHFDVQLIGGMVLNDGKIAEMKTGEGKTLVATLAVALNALKGESVYVVTVNDYLAHRDSKEMEPLYHFLGYSVGTITASVRDDDERLEIYSKDIVYGTNNEFGFDYLRDNMKYSLEHKVQKSHAFAIVDEVDSILIDEARTPLIISGPVDRRMENYNKADEVAKSMQVEIDFTIDEKNRAILITEEGIKKAENLFGVDNLYKIENAALSHHLDQALKANYLFFIDKDYIVANNEVVIVDEFTGRLSEGRRFSEGLHQALEAKEGVSIKEESQTLADITFQNYFRMFSKLAGMTGTAQTEATEFLEIYNLEVVSIPTNLAIKRKDLNDLIYKSEKEKFDAVILKIKELHDKGQPVLVGTASIEKSETLHALLKKERIPHTVLNAKQHTKEAEIIKDAGLKGAVTIATNMAGRGVDIKLTDEIKELGGLYIIGTERHESRRIDNQLRGRSGRQGDPGTSQFYLSLEDNLLRIFGSDRIKGVMEKLGLKDGEHIESKLVTRAVENAQKKVENLHFESRKHLLEYDDVANEQRKSVYKFRDELLDVNYDISAKIAENREYALNQIFSKLKAFDHQNLSEEELLGLKNILKEDFNAHVSLEDLKKASPIENFVAEKLKSDYENKMKVLDSEQRSRIERIVYLQILDNAWREHLYTMDNLKTGINLRGYNQKDPLVEYKKESYNLFLEFIEDIKTEAIKTFSKIQFENEQDSSDAERYLDNFSEEREHESVTYRHEEALDEDLNVAMKAFAKTPKRNEPCPCQSGKKYKDCCAKSGPKKGLFAK